MVTYQFHKTNNIIGKTIRLYSKYSHVSIKVQGYVYEAVMGRGVIKTPESEWSNDTVVRVEIFEGLDENLIIKFLEAQLDKDYDYFGVISFMWRIFPTRVGYWYCSELAMVSLMKGLGKEEYDQRQSPVNFYYVTQYVK